MREYLPILRTKRLILREISEIDIYDMYEYSKLPYVGPSAGWEPHVNLAHTKEVIKLYNRKKNYGQLGVFAVVLKDDGKMIGTCELHSYTANFKAELGYTISPSYWGNGYAVEASKAVLKWGFEELGLKRIECTCFCDNEQSKRVCEKLYFTYEGIRKNGYMLYNGKIFDLECFAMTDFEYREIVKQGLYDKTHDETKMNSFVLRHKVLYPEMEEIDVFKLYFQSIYLGGHILSSNAKTYLEEEIKSKISTDNLLYEYISDDVVRINIFPFTKKYSVSKLYDIFMNSSLEELNTKSIEPKEKESTIKIPPLYNKYLNEYIERKIIPSHSNTYKSLYNPSYRVAKAQYLTSEMKAINFLSFLERNTYKKKRLIVALEGRCSSGKTTLCQELVKLSEDITVINVDDFFSPTEGEVLNIRSLISVLESLRKEKTVKYMAYNCHSKMYYPKEIKVKNICVLEGVYSYLPDFRKYYDFLGYMIVDASEQDRRLRIRETEESYQRFITKWIPREEEYYQSFDFILNADILL